MCKGEQQLWQNQWEKNLIMKSTEFAIWHATCLYSWCRFINAVSMHDHRKI